MFCHSDAVETVHAEELLDAHLQDSQDLFSFLNLADSPAPEVEADAFAKE